MINLLLGLALSICSLSNDARFGGASWVSFRGDPAQTGVAGGKLPDKLNVAWTFEAGDAIESTAAISGNTVYVGSWMAFFMRWMSLPGNYAGDLRQRT